MFTWWCMATTVQTVRNTKRFSVLSSWDKVEVLKAKRFQQLCSPSGWVSVGVIKSLPSLFVNWVICWGELDELLVKMWRRGWVSVCLILVLIKEAKYEEVASDWDYKADPSEDTYDQHQNPLISPSSSSPLKALVQHTVTNTKSKLCWVDLAMTVKQ